MKNVRKQFIIDCVDYFKKNYPMEYYAVTEDVIDQRKKLEDKNFAKLVNSNGIRLGLRMPNRLLNMLQMVLKDENKQFLAEKGEDVWFAKKYPEFLVPSKF